MQTTDIHRLRQLNKDFYQANHASFSETRQHAWPGWERVVSSLEQPIASVLDVACGNMRFREFLIEPIVMGETRYYGIDSCRDLLPDGFSASFQELDIISALIEDQLTSTIQAPECHLVACFGFMHHVPTAELRRRLLDSLLDKTADGGTLALSFWKFAEDAKMAAKAKASTERGCAQTGIRLEENDYLLGWGNVPDAYRYCHSFTNEELDALTAHCAAHATLVDGFKADGRTGKMNGYLVFRKS